MTRGLLVVALGVALGGCAGVHRYHPNFYSVDGDVSLGRELSREVESEVAPVRHAGLTQLVGRIGQRLVASSPEPAFRLFPYSFKVVDTTEVNAFALPGGPVYVHMGLIELCETEDELAAVLAHEMSHVAARHGTEMMTTENLTQIVMIAAVSFIPVPVPAIAWEGAKLGLVLGFLRYSRGMEAEADELGLRVLAAAGYDPHAMATVFQRLDEEQHSMPSLVERFLSSHPLTHDRIAAVNEQLATLPVPQLPPAAAGAGFVQAQTMFAKD